MTFLTLESASLAQSPESKKPKLTERWPHALVMVVFGGTKDAGASVTAAKVGIFRTRIKCNQAISEIGPPNYSVGELKDWLQVAYLCVPENSP
jgi:hypothetical protein